MNTTRNIRAGRAPTVIGTASDCIVMTPAAIAIIGIATIALARMIAVSRILGHGIGLVIDDRPELLEDPRDAQAKEETMKKLTIGILLAAFIVTFAGCHWRHRHHDYGYYDRHSSTQMPNHG
jgi:hypothetical protein